MISFLRRSPTSLAMTMALVGLIIFLPACAHRKVVQIGSHRITVSRHGFERKRDVLKNSLAEKFEYTGISTDGKGLKVAIEGDQININGVDGKLRPGDSVLISDEGVAVNSMDYGQSEKYLRDNNSVADVSALH